MQWSSVGFNFKCESECEPECFCLLTLVRTLIGEREREEGCKSTTLGRAENATFGARRIFLDGFHSLSLTRSHYSAAPRRAPPFRPNEIFYVLRRSRGRIFGAIAVVELGFILTRRRKTKWRRERERERERERGHILREKFALVIVQFPRRNSPCIFISRGIFFYAGWKSLRGIYRRGSGPARARQPSADPSSVATGTAD